MGRGQNSLSHPKGASGVGTQEEQDRLRTGVKGGEGVQVSDPGWARVLEGHLPGKGRVYRPQRVSVGSADQLWDPTALGWDLRRSGVSTGQESGVGGGERLLPLPGPLAWVSPAWGCQRGAPWPLP